MGDRTKIADALMCPLGGTLPPDSVPRGHYWDGGFYHCPCGAIVEWVSDDRVAEHQDARVAAALPALDAAGFDVVLRADPDTSDELAAEARQLLDAANTAPRSHRCPDGMVDDVISWRCQCCGEWQVDFGPQTDCAAAPEPKMVHAPVRLIAALLERAEREATPSAVGPPGTKST
jgi:hypothetical protein